LASGNTQEEAICHALFEVLEREFETQKLVFIADQQVDLSTIQAPHLLLLLDKIKQSKLRLDVWDITNEMQIPAYFAVIHDPEDLRSVGMIMGSGAHFSSVVALSRAITEAIQGRLTIISGSRDDQTPRIYKKIKNVNSQLLNAFEKAKKEPIPFVETPVPVDFVSCQRELLQRLSQYGFNQVIVYNHTRKDLDIPVVQVMVPGLRYVHGSCFSCPVSML
jgi:ribosomal protein S12 methylthiotransferase accessory factor